jgi:MobA/MobL family
MADYRLHASIIGRSTGQSAVAAAAYRAGERILDERTGLIKDYTRKRGILDTLILTPGNAPEWLQTRARLWNDVEHREDKSTRRSTAQLAREIQISLPHELTHEQRVELACDFFKKEFVEHGVVADIAIHAPPRGGDDRNHHAHVLLTLREVGREGFGKKARLWEQQDGSAKRKSWKQFEADRLVEWRRLWAVYENRALERYGHAQRVDHRRLKDQGIDREPTTHIGPDANEMERRGINTDRGDQNRRIKSTNDNLALLKQELAESEKRLAELKQQQAGERVEQIQKTVRAVDAVWKNAEGRWPPTPEGPPEPEPPAPVQPLQPQGSPPYPEVSAPPVSAGGKAVSMPDDLSKAQKLAAEQQAARETQAQDDQLAREQKALDDEKNRLQQLRDADNKRVEDIAKQNADRLAAQAEEMRQTQLRLDAQKEQQARLDAYRSAQEKIADDARRKVEIERQSKLEDQYREGPIRDAGARYGQALGQHYDMLNPYESLAKAAMAEYAAFRKDREALDQQIARTADPQERQALDLRKRIEGAEYIIMTSDRIAQQSVVITGRRDSDEAVKFRKRGTDYRIQAQDLRQQLRQLNRQRAPEKDAGLERTEPRPQPTPEGLPRNRAPDEYERIKTVDDATKAKRQEKDKDEAKDPERQTQQERERELQRKRDRER